MSSLSRHGAYAQKSDNRIVPIDWLSFKKGQPADSLSVIERKILVNANKYALTTWYNEVKGYGRQTGAYLDWGGTGEHNIRAGGSEAFALAVAIRTGAYDAKKTGVSVADATAITLKLIRSGAYSHKANTAAGWGDAWQSALWAAYIGAAGWMMWDELPPADREYVRMMVEYEANRFNDYAVPYYKDRDGKVVYKGDSKAEENAWNAMILQVATAMMPDHPNRGRWMDKNIELELSAAARPEDVHSTKEINGMRLDETLNGSNYNSDGTVVNHNIIHPDYMTCNSFFNALMYTLAGRPTPKAVLFNEDIIYRALVDHPFPSPPYQSPGGAIYKKGSAGIYYPYVNDWGAGRKMHFALMDCQVHALGLDRLASKKGDYWEALHARAVWDMQQRSADGRTYQSLKEDNYAGREEWVAMQAAQAYLTKWLMKQGKFAVTNASYAGNPRLVKVGDGWAKNSVNTVVFRHNSLVTYKDTQYVAFYDDSQRVVIGKRKTGAMQWEIRVTQYKGNATDAHRSISIMVDGAGYLHLSWDHHNNVLHYCRSISPGSLLLTAEMPMTGHKEQRVTYPEFYRLPNGNLLFFYRDGSSGNGDLMLNHYDVSTQQWTQLQDGWINGEGQRNAYWQMATDQQGTIHLSWVWRETGDVATNHDICYARSRDEGKTWEKSTGEKYTLPITAATAEVACAIPQKSELINTTSMAADEKGRPYIATYWRLANETIPQYRLVYNDGRRWVVRQVSDRTTPFSLSGGGTKRIPIARPQIMVSTRGAVTRGLMVFRDEERNDKVSVAVCDNLEAGKWRIIDLTTESVGQWEPSYDTELWKQKKVLDLFVEKVEQGDGERIKEIAPQPVEVLEWKPDWTAARETGAGAIAAAGIRRLLERVADWQIDYLNRKGFRWPVNEWVYATFYKGLWKTAEMLHEKRYLDTLKGYCEKVGWKVGAGERRDFADDYCIGEVYCDFYQKDRQPEMIADFRGMADTLAKRPHTESLEYKNKIYFREWAWCDALFMGPASLAALSGVTKDPLYLQLEDTLWWRTYDYLYDKEEHLFYRDSRFFTEREKNGAKKFWARGNGWVLAGLARLLENMPAGYPSRGRYEQVFKEMAAKIAALQQPDGMWRASLLDPDDFPAKETSGTGLFCYGLAWGIHHGLLDKAMYYPVVKRAWDALTACVHPDGKLGYVQIIADKPGVTGYEDTDAFGVGAFLLSGTEMLQIK